MQPLNIAAGQTRVQQKSGAERESFWRSRQAFVAILAILMVLSWGLGRLVRPTRIEGDQFKEEQLRIERLKEEQFKEELQPLRNLIGAAKLECYACSPPGFDPSPSDWSDAVIYSIIVDRFARSGKSIASPPTWPDNRAGGEVAGINDHLVRLKELGISVLLLSPLAKHRGDYHGYCVTDPASVDLSMGTEETLKDLKLSARQLGIRIVLDVAINHLCDTGSTRYAGTSTPEQIDKCSECMLRNKTDCEEMRLELPFSTNFTGPWKHADYFSRCGLATKVQMDAEGAPSIYGDFASGFFDINSNSLHAATLMALSLELWLVKFDLDGFRLDAAKHVSSEYLRFIIDHLHSSAKRIGKENLFILGEVAGSRSLQDLRKDSGLTHLYNFELAGFTVSAASGSSNKGERIWRSQFEQEVERQEGIGSRLVFTELHDWPRLAGYVDTKIAIAAAVFALLLPGLPMVYYGQEFGLTGKCPQTWLSIPCGETIEVCSRALDLPYWQQFTMGEHSLFRESLFLSPLFMHCPAGIEENLGEYCNSCPSTRAVGLNARIDNQMGTLGEVMKNLFKLRKMHAELRIGKLHLHKVEADEASGHSFLTYSRVQGEHAETVIAISFDGSSWESVPVSFPGFYVVLLASFGLCDYERTVAELRAAGPTADGTLKISPRLRNCFSFSKDGEWVSIKGLLGTREGPEETDGECPSLVNSKTDCGFFNITQQRCEAKGCCWDLTSSMNCYPRGPSHSERAFGARSDTRWVIVKHLSLNGRDVHEQRETDH